MRPHFILIYIGAIGLGCFNKYVSAQCLPVHPNGTGCSGTNSTHNGHDTAGMCISNITQSTCSPSTTSTTRNFLQCVGLPVIMSENSVDHMRNLKGVIDTALNVYSFMRSSFSQGPILELSGGISAKSEAEQFHDLDFVKMWLQVKLKPLLSTVTRQFLSCLSTKNFSCETYQAVVKELSLHFSNMDPVRQRWIYMFFMYPFLARNGTAGCVAHLENSEDWLMKNFGSFSGMATFKDFTALNIVFSGLEVLHLLTPEQKAELILHPEVGGLDNGTIHLVFESLIKSFQENQHTNASRPLHDMTTSVPILHSTTLGPMPNPQNGLQMAFNGFLVFLKPLGGFVKEFASLTHQQNLPSLKSTTLAQAMINWTLAELAGHFTQNITAANEINAIESSKLGNFDFTDIDDWFQQVVVPVLKRFLPDNQSEIPMDLAAVFYHLFSLNSNLNDSESDTPNECSVTIQEPSCSIPSAVENLAYVLRCFSQTNLTTTEENMRMLVTELSQILNTLVGQYFTLNFSSAESHFIDLFGRLQTESFTNENLNDVEYIGLWFQIKLKPLLPSVSQDFLFCLSNKNFSCETFQVLIVELSDHILLMDEMKRQLIYTHFIHPFLLRHKYTDSSCSSSTSSLEWVTKNFGKFSIYPTLQNFFDLHSNFSALEALPALSAKQMAELVASPESGIPQKEVVINTVFDHLLESPKERNLKDFLHYLILFSTEALISCESYNIILGRLDLALLSLPWEFEPVIWTSLNELILSAPEDCIFANFACPMTTYNETRVCAEVNSTELQHYLDTGNITSMLCQFSIAQYACSSLMDLKAESLVTLLKCRLPGNMMHSKEIWKIFLSKASGVLDEALNIFSNMTSHISSPSTTHFLDILGELRIDGFTEEQLADVDFISKWFHGNLRPFLSSVSGEFLRCLSTKNFSCETYQQVIKEFTLQFLHLEQMRQEMVVRYFIVPFLSRNTSDPACVSNTNGSLDWLNKNFGPFSVILSLKDLHTINQDFDPLEALPALSPKQMAELVVPPESGIPQKNVINKVFDHLLESPRERNLNEFLHYLILFSTEKSNRCDSYNIILGRLDLALRLVPRELEPVIWASLNELMLRAPDDCIPGDFGCPMTLYNETRVCASVNSTELQLYLDNGNMISMLCQFSIAQYACSSLMDLKAESLVTLLKCRLPGNMMHSKEIWKIFLSKASGVLDEALNIFSNMTSHISSPSTTHFLDILGELRIDGFTEEQLADVDFISKWFHGNLRPFLSSVSGEFLRCLSTKNFSCETYQQVVKAFIFPFPQMDQMTQELLFKYFILPMLLRNTSDPACVSSTNGSVDWLNKNFGPFSVLVPLKTLLTLNQAFDPLEAVPVLSAKQMAELIVFSQAGPSQKNIVNTVFDHLQELPDKKEFTEFLHNLILFSRETKISCDSYKTIFSRLYQALPSVPQETEPVIWTSINELMLTAPADCMPDIPGCSLTPQNETKVCADVNSSGLQHFLDTGNKTEELCHFDIEQYACSSLNNFTVENLVSLLKCKLSSNMTYSKETWKVFLTKASGVLNEALNIVSDMSFHVTSPSTSHFLEILGELRIDKFSEEQLADVNLISKWFHGYLSPFLSSVSGEFLRCLNTKNFSCETYQQVVKEFSFQYPNMNQMRRELVAKYFILPFLSQNTSDPACVSSTNGSVDWINKNFGQFSVLLPLKTLLTLNQDFAPLEALPFLSAKQVAELAVFTESGPPQEVIINTVFDHLLESPKERNLNEFLHYLILFSTEANISCDSYKDIFKRLNQALSLVPAELVLTITSSSEALMRIAPPICLTVVFSGECDITPVNESVICAGVNSSVLQRGVWDGSIKDMLCSFSIEQYACISPIGLTAHHLVTLLQCKLNSNVTSSKETWKLFLTKVSGILDETLELFSNMNASSSNPSTSFVLEVIGEIRIDSFSTAELRDMDFISQWFQIKLKPFLPFVSKEFLSCLSTKNFSCQTYQSVVKILGKHYEQLNRHQKILIYTDFIDLFLSPNDTSDPGCVSSTNGSADWLERNFGSFIDFASVMDFRRLNMGFSPMDALSHLTLNQLSEAASTPGQLNNPEDVNKLMSHVKAIDLGTFFDTVSPAIQALENFPSSVRSEMLQQVFDRGNLSEPSVSDAEITVWLQNRFNPLLANLSLSHVAPFFGIVKERQCATSQHALNLLDSIHSTLQGDTQMEIYTHILTSLKEPVPVHCYTNGSFYLFLERSFLSFQFPNITTFISLMPKTQRSELINSIPLTDLGDFLMRPNVVDNNEGLCTIFNDYHSTPDFLETQEDIPDDVRRSVLPCVWPLALTSENDTEVNLWFERRLKQYLTFLTKDLISSTETLNAKCLPFRKIIFTLGDNYQYNNVDFTMEDVYGTIKTYLGSGTKPKCYNTTHPQLNSKAWFANYIGRFITYITLDDLNTFGTAEQLQVFSTNLHNVELFNHSGLPANVSSYYTELIYSEDSDFNPMLLPVHLQCYVPGSAFSQLNSAQSMIILYNLNQTCNEPEPEVSAALAGNFQHITSDIIAALGKESVGLTTGQILAIPPSEIMSSLSILSTVTGWNQGQSIAIVEMLLKANFAIVTGSQLRQLGSLVKGVPSNIITNIESTEILQTSQNPSFIANLMAAPQIIQQKYVAKIISVNSKPEMLLENVPNTLATEIPRALLQFPPESSAKVNKKKWKYEQAVLFFDIVATGFPDENEISTAVLQGFTCTRVQRFSKNKVRNLIKACRRKGVNKVVLRENQLTCMYNYIKDFDTDSFQQYPPDMLLYYNYNDVRAKCRAYFTEIGDADYAVISDSLKEKKDTLLDNAKNCLGIRGTSINRTNVEILGNMCCILNGSYIENSDPLIVEKLKNCEDLSEVQIASVQKVLLSGNTQYGQPSTWDLETLYGLGNLTLSMKTEFWKKFGSKVKRRFIKRFLKAQRKDRKKRRKFKKLFKELNMSLRSKRAAATNCTAGSITQVDIRNDDFPLGYDASQFGTCLSVTTLRENLAGLTEKVDVDDSQIIILDKLNQAYPTGVPEEQVQVLGPVSRVASIDDINNWNLASIDTLAALMISDDGPWEQDKSKAIIMKYLATAGNSLGIDELNAIGGTNLCSLDLSVLKSITQSSLKNANALHLSHCSTEKKKVLFTVANQAFSNRQGISLLEYQLMEPFLGGAPVDYIKRLTVSNVSMDISTLIGLDENVINDLTVNDVRQLLGLNLFDLKTYENETTVAKWISEQLKSELNTLGLELTGGKDDPTPTGVGFINTTTTAGGSTTTIITTSGCDGSSKKSSYVPHLLLVLAFTTLIYE